MMWRRVWFGLLLCGGPLWGQAKHIRVILDTSQSLCAMSGRPGTDQPGNLKLAGALLYALSSKTMSPGDTFQYYFFDPKWPAPGATLPASVGREISPPVATASGKHFLRDLLDQPYDAPQTYFYPGLRRAYDDLSSPRIPATALKVIVLLTDGLSDNPRVEAEKLQQLSTQVRDAGIKLFVLTFNTDPNIAQKSAEFFEQSMSIGQSGPPGNVSTVTPESLLGGVMDVFCRSFGWGKELVEPSHGLTFSVSGGVDLSQAAVVALYNGSVEADFQLHAGGQNQGQIDDRVPGRQAICSVPVTKTPNSYTIAWVPSPRRDNYTFEPLRSVAPYQIAILRPRQVRLNFNPASKYSRVTMETRELKIEAIAAPENQPQGDLSDIELEMRVAYLRRDEQTGRDSWSEDPQTGQGQILQKTSDGSLVLFTKTLNRDTNCPADPSRCAAQKYSARIRLVAKRAGIEVSQVIETYVTVYPYLEIGVEPGNALTLLDSRGDSVLKAGATGTANFRLVFRGGRIRDGKFFLGARLADGVKFEGPLRGAAFHLSNSTLEPGGPGFWSVIDSYRWSSLTEPGQSGSPGRPFEVSMRVGKPSRGTQANKDGPIEMQLGLWDEASRDYEDYSSLIEPIRLQLQVAEPGFWTTWGSLIASVLALLSLAAASLLLRMRGGLPPDLQIATAPGSDPAAGFKLIPPTPPPVWSRWIGRIDAQPITSPDQSLCMGHLRSLARDLYRFVPAKPGTWVEQNNNGQWEALPAGDGSYALESARAYRIHQNGQSCQVRVGYAKDRLPL